MPAVAVANLFSRNRRRKVAERWGNHPEECYPMAVSELAIEVLKQIRDAVQTNTHGIAGLREQFGDLTHRVVEAEVRTATAVSDLAVDVRALTALLREQHDLRPRVERCEQDIRELRATVGQNQGQVIQISAA